MAIKENNALVQIQNLDIQKTTIRIIGTSPQIVHAWSQKAKQEMLDKQMKVTKTKARDAKNPVEDFIRSLYWCTPMPEEMTEAAFDKAVADGAKFGFPVTAFKQAANSAAYRLGWVKNQTALRGAWFIEPDFVDESGIPLVEIHGDTPIPREDMVRVGMGTADIRYRGEFRNWWADLKIQYNASGVYSLDQLINILHAGGFACGVGEWRPERDGQNGMFNVLPGSDVPVD